MLAVEVPGGGPVDHVVLGVSDTRIGTEYVAERTGIEPRPASLATPPTSPTRSVGLHLGGERFLEVFAPNPDYDGPDSPMRTFLGTLDEPRLLTWFARVRDLAETARVLAGAGEELRTFLDVVRSDAPSYRNGHLAAELFNPSIPFLIEWRDRLDMDARMAVGCELAELWVTARMPRRTRAVHDLLGIDVRVESGASDRVYVRLETPLGEVVV